MPFFVSVYMLLLLCYMQKPGCRAWFSRELKGNKTDILMVEFFCRFYNRMGNRLPFYLAEQGDQSQRRIRKYIDREGPLWK